jgi:hypothetical protein
MWPTYFSHTVTYMWSTFYPRYKNSSIQKWYAIWQLLDLLLHIQVRFRTVFLMRETHLTVPLINLESLFKAGFRFVEDIETLSARDLSNGI